MTIGSVPVSILLDNYKPKVYIAFQSGDTLNTLRYIALAVLVLLAAYPAFGQCDTVAPSGKVLFSDPGEWRTETGYPRIMQVLDSMQNFTTRVRVDSPCVVVKAFGCPTCGSEKRGFVVIHYSAAVDGAGKFRHDENMDLNVCSECGTVYSGRRRK